MKSRPQLSLSQPGGICHPGGSSWPGSMEPVPTWWESGLQGAPALKAGLTCLQALPAQPNILLSWG